MSIFDLLASDVPADRGPQWLRASREAAAGILANLDFPSAEEEIWRYSRIGEMKRGRYNVALDAAPVEVPADVTQLLASLGPRAGLVMTNNGVLVESELDEAVGAKGVRLVGADVLTEVPVVASVDERDAFSVANQAYATSPIYLDVPNGVTVENPIVVVHNVSDNGVAAFPRLVIHAGVNSQVSVIEVVTSGDIDAVVVPETHANVEDGANVTYVNLQLLGRTVWQVARQSSVVGRDATFRSTSAAFGGHYARVRTDSRLNGQGGNAYLNAVYFGDRDQQHDFRTLQEHIAPKTTSDLVFKGAVAGTAHSVYSGLIRVRKGAAGTNAFQTNRNLVLSQGAHADSVPNLEIDEQDVRCSHASAVGPVDEEQQYYLESRGVPTEVAERLIVIGFLEDLLANAGVPAVVTSLRDHVAAKFDEFANKA